jgi:hypothetical protein
VATAHGSEAPLVDSASGHSVRDLDVGADALRHLERQVGGHQAGLDATAQDEQTHILAGGEWAWRVRVRAASEDVPLVAIAGAQAVERAGCNVSS